MKRIYKRSRKEDVLRILYAVAILLLLSSYLITLYSNRQIIRQIARVQHTNNVIKTLDNIQASIKDAETGVRGYVLTSDIRFLHPFYGSEKRADSFYAIAHRLTKDNPYQQERLQSLKKQIDRRFQIFNFSISSFEENHMVRSDSMLKLQPEAMNLMNKIQEVTSQLQGEEEHLLKERENNVNQSTQKITIITIVSLSLAFLLFLAGIFAYRQINKARKKAIMEVMEYELQLKNRIADLDKANAELVRIRRLEKQAATGRIARAIAHEVRNPLTNINLANDQLRTGMIREEQERDFLFEMINRNSSRINQLIADLLSSTKTTELNYEKVSLHAILDETLDEARDRIILGKVQIIKHYSPGICEVSVDKEKIKIAFLNIIINAIEAMDGLDERVLTITTATENKKCRIIISDTGPGMDNESLTRLFEAFFTSKPNGYGLGLTNTQNIILGHNGDISVDSKPGKGSSFLITLDVS
ncbi:MAG: CHASE3 domain-containing protein [Chitinophagaceae bacterium]